VSSTKREFTNIFWIKSNNFSPNQDRNRDRDRCQNQTRFTGTGTGTGRNVLKVKVKYVFECDSIALIDGNGLISWNFWCFLPFFFSNFLGQRNFEIQNRENDDREVSNRKQHIGIFHKPILSAENFQQSSFYFWVTTIAAHERTFPTIKSLSSWNYVHRADPSEVWKPPKGQVPLGLLSRVMGMIYTSKSNDGISTWDFAHR
jgi:hypothetical protein